MIGCLVTPGLTTHNGGTCTDQPPPIVPPGLLQQSSESLDLSHEYLTRHMMRCRVTSLQYWTSQVTALCIINVALCLDFWPHVLLSWASDPCLGVISWPAPGPQPRPAPGHSATLSVASEQPTSKHLCDLLWTHAELHDKYKVFQTIDLDE